MDATIRPGRRTLRRDVRDVAEDIPYTPLIAPLTPPGRASSRRRKPTSSTRSPPAGQRRAWVAAEDRRLLDATWMDEAGIERAAWPAEAVPRRASPRRRQSGPDEAGGHSRLQGSHQPLASMPIRGPDAVHRVGDAVRARHAEPRLLPQQGRQFDAYRAAYLSYVTKLFELIGDADPGRFSQAVIALENKIATVALDRRSARRNVKANQQPYGSRPRSRSMCPASTGMWCLAVSASAMRSISSSTKPRRSAMEQGCWIPSPSTRWKAYLTFHFVIHYAADLPKAFDERALRFPFEGVTRGGATARSVEARHQACSTTHIGEGLGQIYVASTSAPRPRRRWTTSSRICSPPAERGLKQLDLDG